MDRINTRYSTEDRKFTEGNPSLGLQATEFSALWCNNVQEELANAVIGGGVALDANNQQQLLKVIRLGGREAQSEWVPGGQFVPDESTGDWDLTDGGGFSTKATGATPIARWSAKWVGGQVNTLTYHYRVAAVEGGMQLIASVYNLTTNVLGGINTFTMTPSAIGKFTHTVTLNRPLAADERLVVRCLLNSATPSLAPITFQGMDTSYTPPV